MVRSVAACTIFLVLAISFSVGTNAVVYEEPEEASIAKCESHMSPTDFYTPHAPIAIYSNEDFAGQGWPGNGTLGNPYVIAGLNITADEVCIRIMDATVYFEVRDCIISSEIASLAGGIVLENVDHGAVRNCIIDLHYYGIYWLTSTSYTLTNNTVSNAEYGIWLSDSGSSILTNNTVSNTVYGIALTELGSSILTNNTAISNDYGLLILFTDNCTMTHNTAISNDYGFFLSDNNGGTLTSNTASSNILGFSVKYSNSYTMTHNTATSNDYGFYLLQSNSCTMTHNTATNNDYGFFLDALTENNTLCLNRLGNNGISNAQDNGSSNYWDDGISSGNYWLDYNGTGTYPINGSAGSVDNYPFVWENVVPIVNSPLDVEYNESSTGHNITWIASDNYPRSYTIYQDGSVIISESWNGSQITVEIDGLSPGVYNYTIAVTDAGGNVATDTVFVTVHQTAISTTTTTMTATNTTTTTTSGTGDTVLTLVFIGTGIVIVVLVIVIVMKKKG